MSTIQLGDPLPSVEVYDGEAANKVNIRDLFAGKKGILFGVPGAFTPGCSKIHLPSYVDNYEELKAKGVEVVACISVNDVFVMKEWGESKNATGKIHMLADPNADFAKATGLTMESEMLGGTRTLRFSMVIEDGLVCALNLEPGGKGISCTLSQNLFSQL